MDNNNKSTKEIWQEKILAKLVLWKDRILYSGSEIIYGTFCAAALFPVFEAMQNGDPSLLLALSGSIGANLIANQIQIIIEAGEKEAPKLLQEKIEENEEERVELEHLLKELDVIELTRAIMNDEEREVLYKTIIENKPKECKIKLERKNWIEQPHIKYTSRDWCRVLASGLSSTGWPPRTA